MAIIAKYTEPAKGIILENAYCVISSFKLVRNGEHSLSASFSIFKDKAARESYASGHDEKPIREFQKSMILTRDQAINLESFKSAYELFVPVITADFVKPSEDEDSLQAVVDDLVAQHSEVSNSLKKMESLDLDSSSKEMVENLLQKKDAIQIALLEPSKKLAYYKLEWRLENVSSVN